MTGLQTKRMTARYALSLGSLGLMGGAVISFFGHDLIGDALMIGGGVLLVVGAFLLAAVPTGEDDADR